MGTDSEPSGYNRSPLLSHHNVISSATPKANVKGQAKLEAKNTAIRSKSGKNAKKRTHIEAAGSDDPPEVKSPSPGLPAFLKTDRILSNQTPRSFDEQSDTSSYLRPSFSYTKQPSFQETKEAEPQNASTNAALKSSRTTVGVSVRPKSVFNKSTTNDLNEAHNGPFKVHGTGNFWASSSPMRSITESCPNKNESEIISSVNPINVLCPSETSPMKEYHLGSTTRIAIHTTEDNATYETNDFASDSDQSFDEVQQDYQTFDHPVGCDPEYRGEGAYEDGIDDDDLLELIDEVAPPSSFKEASLENSNTSCAKQQEQDDGPNLICGSSESYDSPKKGNMGKFTSPVTQITQIRNMGASTCEKRPPIVRARFPSKVLDRSLVIGLSSDKMLRTCFRIGEAINVGRDAVKNNKDIIIELYARIMTSSRDHSKQRMILCDLFHTKQPYLSAEYPSIIWRSTELHNIDSARLLKGNRMCRCMGKMKREEKNHILDVMNIWECTLEDIEWVEGIVNA